MNIKLELPETFYYGEERCGYYVSPEMKKVWAVELDLIAEFARVCEKYNLNWYATGGTLLGAARHKGFIPWDDDVDVIMLREEYEKLCEVADKEFQQPYFWSTHKNNPYSMAAFAKLHNSSTTMFEESTIELLQKNKPVNFNSGIYIDIFPIGDAPYEQKEIIRTYKKAYKQIHRAFFYRRMTDDYTPSPVIWRWPFKMALHNFLKIFNIKLDYNKLFLEFLETIKSSVYPNSKYLAEWYWTNLPNFMEKRIWERAWFSEKVYLPFETLTLPSPIGYENILTKLYGDWHKFEITHHHGVFFDTEHPYTYYTEEGHEIPQTKF